MERRESGRERERVGKEGVRERERRKEREVEVEKGERGGGRKRREGWR